MSGVWFSEANEPWRDIPHWARFLIHFGYQWPSGDQESRRLALISMPCDSAAAGLVALGSMMRDLADPIANDIDGHYNALLRYARQYIESCRLCDLATCDPPEKGCGYETEVSGKVRSESERIYTVSTQTNFEARQLAFVRNGVVTKPKPQFVINWRIDGMPPIIGNNVQGELSPAIYEGLPGYAQIVPENLRRTYSGTCLAGRSAGETTSREVYASVRFRNASGERRLDEMLTIHGWACFGTSRLAFFNARTGQLDRRPLKPSLVIADGDAAFLSVLDYREFQGSDVIGVVHRVVDRDRLEAVGAKIQDLGQWYVPDEDLLCSAPSLPRGISLSILRRSR